VSDHLYRDTGVVLRTHKLGEADRIIVLLGQEHGKVRAVAKGVRKTKSRFGARLEPLSHVRVLMHKGRNLDVVSQAELVDGDHPALGDLDRTTQGLALVEAVELLAPDRDPLRFPAGQLPRQRLGPVLDIEALEQPPRLALGFMTRLLVYMDRRQRDVVEHAQMLEQAVKLEDHPGLLTQPTHHCRIERTGADDETVDRHLPAIERLQSQHRPQDGRLTRPRRTHQRYDGARLDLQIDAGQDRPAAARQMEIADVDRQGVHMVAAFHFFSMRRASADSGSDIAR
jgi:hypothetical protein